MKKKVTFNKKIELSTTVGEITAISLEPSLTFVDSNNLNGDLILSGRYKLTEASRLEEDFSYKIPIEITLTTKIDADTANVDITDFTYELLNNNEIDCDIELLIEGEELLEERECDDEEKEIELPSIEQKEEVVDAEELIEDTNYSLFTNLDEDSETYGTFIVYIVRGDETINSIIEKYNTTLEEIEKYNDVKDMKIGTKLIIPILNAEN